MPAELDPKVEFKRLRFSLNRSIRYHDCRGNFLRSFSRFCTLITLLVGTGATVAVAKEAPKWIQLLLPVIVAAISLTSLLFDFRGAGDLHRKLSSKFSELVNDLDSCNECTIDELRRLEKKRREVENEAPTPIKTLDVCCHNDLIRAEGYDPSEFVDLKWWQTALCHFCSVGQIPPKRGNGQRSAIPADAANQ